MVLDCTDLTKGQRDVHVSPLVDHLSPSGIKSYLSCSLRYFFERIEKIPAPVSPALILGSAVHAGIEKINRLQWYGEPCSKEVVLSSYETSFNEKATQESVSWKTEDERDKVYQCGKTILEACLDSSVFMGKETPMGIEVRLSKYIPSLGIELLGFADRINADGTIVDYKTVASTPSIENELWQHQLQLTAYDALVEDGTGQKSSGAEIVFLVKTKTPKIIRCQMAAPTAEQKERFWKLLQVVYEGIHERRFHPQPGMHCNWCSYRTECSKWSGTSSNGGRS